MLNRLLILVEGQTEETVVNNHISAYLYSHGYLNVSARLMGNARMRSQRGGVRPWPSIKKEIINLLKADPQIVITTLVDYYGMPAGNSNGWPGRTEANTKPISERAQYVERAIYEDINSEYELNQQRFIPFVILHEFEGLLFSNCEAIANTIGEPNRLQVLQSISNQFENPEYINDSPTTAPSKRLSNIFPNYNKVVYGNMIFGQIGIEQIAESCPHFQRWINEICALPARSP